MRTSSGNSWAAKLLKFAAALAFVCACNAALTFALEPYGSKSQLSWAEYNKVEAMDTLIVGSSLTEAGINPAVLDEACGTTSFNLGSPYQRIEESLVGIRTAYEDFGIKRVILGVSCSTVTNADAPGPESAFLRQWRKAGHGGALGVSAEMLLRHGSASTADSLNWLAPWVGNHASDIRHNIANKLNKVDLAVAATDLDEEWTYVVAGHGASQGTMSPNSNGIHRYLDAGIAEGTSAAIVAARAATFADIVDYCRAHGIDLVAISMPMPDHNIVDLDAGYFRVMEEFAQLAREHGVEFYDFNCVPASVFSKKPEYYADNTHLNVEGAVVFSQAFAQLYGQRLEGQDIAAAFMTPGDVVASVTSVKAVFVEPESDGSAVTLHCSVAAGPSMKAEYQVYARPSAESQDWQLVQDWTTEPDIVYDPGSRGAVYLRVCARTVGSTEDFERRRDFKALV